MQRAFENVGNHSLEEMLNLIKEVKKELFEESHIINK